MGQQSRSYVPRETGTPLMVASNERLPPILVEVDAIVKKSVGAFYDGVTVCTDTAIEIFSGEFKENILEQKEYAAQTIDDQMVFESFSKTA